MPRIDEGGAAERTCPRCGRARPLDWFADEAGRCSASALTRGQVRDAINANLTYAQIRPNDIRALEGFLCIEYARHDRGGAHMAMRPTYRKATEPVINQAPEGGIEEAYLRVSGSYFSGREAVSFNADGWIGIAGWADDGNVQPFCRALLRWLEEWMGYRGRVLRNVATLRSMPAAQEPPERAGAPQKSERLQEPDECQKRLAAAIAAAIAAKSNRLAKGVLR